MILQFRYTEVGIENLKSLRVDVSWGDNTPQWASFVLALGAYLAHFEVEGNRWSGSGFCELAGITRMPKVQLWRSTKSDQNESSFNIRKVLSFSWEWLNSWPEVCRPLSGSTLFMLVVSASAGSHDKHKINSDLMPPSRSLANKYMLS